MRNGTRITEAAGQAADELSDLDLLASALQEALAAHEAGELAAPHGLDRVALHRAERRARRNDAARLLRTQVAEVAA